MTGSQEIYSKVVGNSIIGYREVIEDFLICLSSGGHILLEGVPGVAKTTLAKAMSMATGLKFSRIQFTQDLLPSDITGHYYYNQKEQLFEFRKGPVFANVILADEINRAPSKTQSALLEAMEEKQVTVEGNTFNLEEPFLVMATINPVELEGVYSLPEAQLDRFMIKGQMDYLPEDEELEMLKLKNKGWRNIDVKRVGGDIFTVLQREIRKCHAGSSILRYVRDIVTATRGHEMIVLGASPRAGEQMLYASKAHAIIAGREFTIPDDVKYSARKLLPHRMTLSLDSELEGMTASMVIEEILGSVEVVKDVSGSSGVKEKAMSGASRI
jgi:MoxR-like ATPase